MDVVRELDCEYVEEQNLVSGYLSGRLSEQDAEAFEKHFFGCEKCWAEVKAGEEIRATLQRGRARVKTPVVSNVRRGPWVRWLALAAAAAIGAAAVGTVLLVRGREASDIAALARAAGTRRTTAARLTGPFEYAQVQDVTRGREDVPVKLRRTALEALEKSEAKPDAETLHAAGVAHLLVDEWDAAVDTLENAVKLGPQDAHILTDLAAAYHTRAIRRDRAADLPPAYENAKHATELDPRLAPAQYNVALILESLGRRDEAREAWQRYLTLDPKSGWADEARAREKSLASPPQSELWQKERERLNAGWNPSAIEAQSLAKRFPQQVRQYVEDDLLTRWADASDPESSGRAFRSARVLAESLAASNGERLALDAVGVIEAGGPIESLRRGHAAFGAARKAYKAADIRQAFADFRLAEDAFRKTDSQFLHLARLGEASCALYGLDASQATTAVAAFEAEAERNSERHRALAGQTLWLRALIEDVRGHPYESFRAFSQALSVFESLGETENVAVLHGQLAGQLEMLGDANGAWVHHLQELALMDRGAPAVRVTNALGSVARLSADQGYTRLALLAEDAEGAAAESSGVPLFESYSKLWRAQLLERMGRTAEARADLSHARANCDRITDAGSRNRARAEIELATVRISSGGNAVEALASADRALAFSRSIDDRGRLPELLLIRGRLHSQAGSHELARADFLAGIDALEASRADIAPQDLRVSYFETGRSLFDEAIENLWQANDRSAAFELADRAHGRVLLDTRGAPANQSTRESTRSGNRLLAKLTRALGPGDALVEYWIGDHGSKAWIARSEGIEAVTLPAGNLAGEIREVANALSKSGVAVDTLLANAYDSAIRPLEPYLQGVREITIVADGPLHTCPFAALRERHRSRYLVEDFAISLSPSAAFLLAARDPRQAAGGVLVFQDPIFDQSRFPDLPRLVATSTDADAISKVTSGVRVLRGGDATADALLASSPDYGVIHFAGHAVADSRDPSLVGLLLAPTEANPSGVLYAHELAGLDLHRTDLVVLAACGTAMGRPSSSDGPSGLSRAFLAAGAQVVVATLWPVADRASGSFFSAFYRHLLRGNGVAEAVRATQREAISAGGLDRLRAGDWASVIVIGDARPATALLAASSRS